jgi:hypothetical protein
MAAFMRPVPLLDGRQQQALELATGPHWSHNWSVPRFVYLVPIVYRRSMFPGERKTS